MGIRMHPFSSTVRVWSDSMLLVEVVLLPERELMAVEELNGTASSGSLLFTTTIRRSRGLIRISPFCTICSGVAGWTSCRYQTRFWAEHDARRIPSSANPTRRYRLLISKKIDIWCDSVCKDSEKSDIFVFRSELFHIGKGFEAGDSGKNCIFGVRKRKKSDSEHVPSGRS